MEQLENVVIQVPVTRRSGRRKRLPTDAQARRVEQLRRAFQRVLRRRPTLIEKASMSRAAALVARAEMLALDPGADVLDVVRLNNLASRILRVLNIRLVEPAPKQSGGLTIARARWAEQRAQEQARTAREATTAKDTEVPPDDRAA